MNEVRGATVIDHQNESGFLPAVQQTNAVTQIEQSRAVAEVQAAVLMAKKFPRDELAAYNRVMQACERPRLAEKGLYAYPRGKGNLVQGVSIHLAKAMAKAWGNLDCGIRALDSDEDETTVESYCWDLETNYKESRTFTVVHERHTKKGSYKLTDPRDIYELVANNGSRRERACILSVLPEDLVADAEARCKRTLAGGKDAKPIQDRVKDMMVAFGKFGVDKALLETRLGHALTAVVETELSDLRMIYNSLKDGVGKRSDFFDLGGPEGGLADGMNEEFKSKTNGSSKPTPSVSDKPAPSVEVAATKPLETKLEPAII